MKIKIIKRKNIVWNLMIFLVLSVIFLHIIKSLGQNLSAFNWGLFKFHLTSKYYLWIFFFLSAVTVLKVKKISRVFLLLFWANIVFDSVVILIYDFNKLIFLMLFIFLFMAFYLYLLWEVELEESIYNPFFDKNDLHYLPKFLIQVKVQLMEDPEQIFQGVLTNWNEHSCFIKLLDPRHFEGKRILMTANFKNRYFENEGEIYTLLDNFHGMGVEFLPHAVKGESKFQWSQFYTILFEFGYWPAYLI